MCGISGYLSQRELVAEDGINRTLNLMKNRGPDFKNVYKLSLASHELSLLHSRLNIIDLNDRANQPFFHEEFVLIFNR